MTSSLIIRFSNKFSEFETTHQRLKDIAEYLGVSQNKAVHYAINKAWENLVEKEEMLEELEFKRRGVKVGKVTYLNADEAFIQRVRDRIANGVPLPHEDDESLESSLPFRFLSKEQQAQVSAATNALEKRKLIAAFLDQIEKSGQDFVLTH